MNLNSITDPEARLKDTGRKGRTRASPHERMLREIGWMTKAAHDIKMEAWQREQARTRRSAMRIRLGRMSWCIYARRVESKSTFRLF